MERARHRLKLFKVSTGVFPSFPLTVKMRLNSQRKGVLFLISVLGIFTCLSASSAHGAEVGVGVTSETTPTTANRGILHRSGEKTRGENKSSRNESISSQESHHQGLNSKEDFERKESNETEEFGSHVANLHHVDLERIHESDKIETILRDIFLDESAEDDFPEEEEFDEVSEEIVSDDPEDLKKSGIFLSRIKRSEHEHEPLFPEARSSRDGNGKVKTKATKGKGKSSKKGEKNKKKSAGKNKKPSKAVDLAKYNDYMDAVFTRMNVLIKKKRMDPLRVNLYAGPSKGGKGKGKGGNKTNNKQKHSPRMDLDLESEEEEDEKVEEGENVPARKDIFLKGHSEAEDTHEEILDENEEDEEEHVRRIRALLERAGTENGTDSEGPRASSDKPKKPNKNAGKNKQKSHNKKKPEDETSEQNQKGKNKNKNKNKKVQKGKPTRGVLHGLSTLHRDGNVAVVRQGEKVRVVRANFFLGPVSLEILPKKTKADGSDSKASATATAPKLKGVLEVRLKKGSPTKIRKLRVYPPKSVKVDGSDASGGKRRPQQYGKVTPMATARLRQVASTVVKQTDNNKKLKPPLEV